MSGARRRLFATTTSSSTTGQITLTIPQQTVNHLSTNETTVINTTPVMSPARNVTIILQRMYCVLYFQIFIIFLTVVCNSVFNMIIYVCVSLDHTTSERTAQIVLKHPEYEMF